jgi:hypothetical protein
LQDFGTVRAVINFEIDTMQNKIVLVQMNSIQANLVLLSSRHSASLKKCWYENDTRSYLVESTEDFHGGPFDCMSLSAFWLIKSLQVEG